VPQLQAIREAYLAVGDSVPIMADGGVKTDKDIFLVLICGASTVMLGSALSGTDEAPSRRAQCTPSWRACFQPYIASPSRFQRS